MSGWAWSDWDAHQDEDNDAPTFKVSSSKDSLILLIDCSKKMFEEGTDSSHPIDLCFKCARSVLLNKIISNDKDMVGIVLFGTEKDKNPSDFKNVFIYQDLDTPDAPRIKDIEELIEGNYGRFSTDYGHSDEFSLSDVLWTCSSMLATSGSKYGHKRILLFTNCANPHGSDPSKQRQAKTRAKDLAENGVEIEVMHIGNDFDFSAFYRDIAFSTDEDVPPPHPSERFEELLTRVRSKEFQRRPMQKIALNLGNGVEIGTAVYCPVREAKKPSFARLDQRTNVELKTQTKMLCEDTGVDLLPTDIKYYQPFGGEKSVFEKDEVQSMKAMCTKGLTLMGFKPMSRLKEQFYLKPASFIYPEEEVVTGSTRFFSALLTKCLDKQVFAVCQNVATANSAPRLVALVPQEEELDENNLQVSPPGFNVLYLPYSEDIRAVAIMEETTTEVHPELVDKAKEIVKKLTFGFDSDAFENPVLQKHYRQLEAIALEKDSAEEVLDLTEPNHDLIKKRVGGLLNDFKEITGASGQASDDKGRKRKGTKTDDDTSRAPKRSKGLDSDVDIVALVTYAAKQNKLKTLTVNQLKAYLQATGKKATGKKQDLIDFITSALEQK